MRSRPIYNIMFIILILLQLVSCKSTETIRIGVVGTMSGNQSDLSVSGRRGIEMAVDEVNSLGGINGRLIELVVKDDENNPEKAKQIVGEFVNEGIPVVIGHYTSGMMLAAYDEVEANDILYLGPTISADSLSERDDHFIRFIASTKEQATIIVKNALKDNHDDFIVVMDQKNLGFNEKLYLNFDKLLKENNGSVHSVVAYNTIDEDLFSRITSEIIKNKEIDGLFIISNATDMAILTQKLRNNNIDIPVYGPLWAHTNDLLRVGGDLVEGVYVVSGVDNQSKNDIFENHREKYESRYGESITFSSMYSYETMMALAEALKSADYEYASIKKEILKIGNFKGLQYDFYIDQFGDNTRQYMLDQIINGNYVRID